MPKPSIKKEKPPATIDEFTTWLAKWSGAISLWVAQPEMAENVCRDCAAVVYEAQLNANRLGLAEFPRRRYLAMPCREALNILASLLAACDRKENSQVAPNTELTVRQAAKRLNISERTVYDLIANGTLPHKRYGTGRGTIRIRLEDLLNHQRQQSAIAKTKLGQVTLEQLRSV